ncbi:MAG: hypothetical protein ACFFDH_18410 [Promethearchaeota archaeon]
MQIKNQFHGIEISTVCGIFQFEILNIPFPFELEIIFPTPCYEF